MESQESRQASVFNTKKIKFLSFVTQSDSEESSSICIAACYIQKILHCVLDNKL